MIGYVGQVSSVGENVPRCVEGEALLYLCVWGDEEVEEGDEDGEFVCWEEPRRSVGGCHRGIWRTSWSGEGELVDAHEECGWSSECGW
jgi:hypothetical protein